MLFFIYVSFLVAHNAKVFLQKNREIVNWIIWSITKYFYYTTFSFSLLFPVFFLLMQILLHITLFKQDSYQLLSIELNLDTNSPIRNFTTLVISKRASRAISFVFESQQPITPTNQITNKLIS